MKTKYGQGLVPEDPDAPKKPPEVSELVKALNHVAATPEGMLVLTRLMRACGHNETSLAQDPNSQEINPLATAYNGGRHSIWLEIRKYLYRDNLIRIEYPIETKQGS
jgi:hypothetical protein